VSQYQKGKTDLDFTEATDNHASTPPLGFFTGRMPFALPDQQHLTASKCFMFQVPEQPNCQRRSVCFASSLFWGQLKLHLYTQ